MSYFNNSQEITGDWASTLSLPNYRVYLHEDFNPQPGRFLFLSLYHGMESVRVVKVIENSNLKICSNYNKEIILQFAPVASHLIIVTVTIYQFLIQVLF